MKIVAWAVTIAWVIADIVFYLCVFKDAYASPDSTAIGAESMADTVVSAVADAVGVDDDDDGGDSGDE